ncbi:MAG: DUF2189 domain-containing protein [Hyphomicrobiaceae bacterium]
MTADQHTRNPVPADATPEGLILKPVRLADIGAILLQGAGDYARAPVVSTAIASFYTVGGWLLAALLFRLNLPYLVYPLAMGFALVAPFVAVAFYAVADQLGRGTIPGLAGVWRAIRESSSRDLRWMALITAFAFFIWMDIAAMITLSFFGATALDLGALITEITTTELGMIFLITGHVIGAIIALMVFSITVVSVPLLYHRDVDVMTAMITSVRLVRRNPVPMAVWCLVIASLIVISIATVLIGLLVILPVVGYASWHLYRRAVAFPSQ